MSECSDGPDHRGSARIGSSAGQALFISGLLILGAASCGSSTRTQLEADRPTPAPDIVIEDAPDPPVAAIAAPAPPEPEVIPDPVPKAPVHADLDPANDDEIGPPTPLDDCEERLAAAGITYDAARIGVGRKKDGVYTCGAHQVVRVRRGPGKIKYSRRPLLTCTMALALADFEIIAQEEAERFMESRIKSIKHLGTYNCREMSGFDLISEHSFANGIDFARFEFDNGESVVVLDDFHPDVANTTDPKALFLRSLANRLYDEGVFSVVVTPYFDHLHRNHIHADLARYRVDGTRP